MAQRIRSHRQLEVYRRAFASAMEIFRFTTIFPREEQYSLTSQIRRSSRSVVSSITEAWRKRRYEPSFISKLSDAETEAAETQTWLEFCVAFGYMSREDARRLYLEYNAILATLVGMITNSHKWVLPLTAREARLRTVTTAGS